MDPDIKFMYNKIIKLVLRNLSENLDSLFDKSEKCSVPITCFAYVKQMSSWKKYFR